ncbi:hypothetical protein QTP88_012433 [Uroleucon formosanum]
MTGFENIMNVADMCFKTQMSETGNYVFRLNFNGQNIPRGDGDGQILSTRKIPYSVRFFVHFIFDRGCIIFILSAHTIDSPSESSGFHSTAFTGFHRCTRKSSSCAGMRVSVKLIYSHHLQRHALLPPLNTMTSLSNASLWLPEIPHESLSVNAVLRLMVGT